jgi:hypothetical protein
MAEALSELQAFLVDALRREDAVTADAALAHACSAHVSGNDRLSPAEQVDIYRRQYWMRHVDSLAEDYPGLQYVLGDDAFTAFCHAYLAAHPPHAPALRDLGAVLPAFAERYDFPAPRRALARDMLRYEHAFIDLFDGPEPRTSPEDPTPLALSAEKLTALPPSAWESARIVLHPLAVRLTLHHRVQAIRYAVKSGESPDLDDVGARSDEPIHLVLFRKHFVIRFEIVDALAARLLDALAAGTPLVPAMNALAADLGAAEATTLEADVGRWFQQWTEWGLIVDVAVSQASPGTTVDDEPSGSGGEGGATRPPGT